MTSDDSSPPVPASAIGAAMILAAGLGTRMRPLTDSMPKPMVPLAGRPLIDHVLTRLSDAGVKRAVVNLHYLGDVLEAHLSQRWPPGSGMTLQLSDERNAILDTGGGVAKALPLLGNAPFLVHNSDSVWCEALECGLGQGRADVVGAVEEGDTAPASASAPASNIDRLIAAWDGEQMDCLLMLAPRETSLGYDGAGDFDLGHDGRLSRRAAGTTAPYVFAGVSIMHPKLFTDLPTGAFSLNLLWNRAIEAGRLYGICATGIWMHVGDPGALELAEAQVASVPTPTLGAEVSPPAH